MLDQAQTAIEQGEMETFQRLADEAHVTMTKADEIDAAAYADDVVVLADGRIRSHLVSPSRAELVSVLAGSSHRDAS